MSYDEPLLGEGGGWREDVGEPSKSGGEASFGSSVINLVISVLGAGILSVPWALSQSSILYGIVLLCVINGVCVYSFVALARVCELGNTFSYLGLGTQAMGRKGGLFLQCVILVHTFFSGISYVIFIGDVLPDAISGVFTHLSMSAPMLRTLTLIGVGVVVLPLCLTKNLDPLRYSSMAAMLGITYTLVVMFLRFLHPIESPAPKVVLNWTQATVCMLPAAPVFSLAFCAHFNAPELYRELSERSVPRFFRVSLAAMLVCLSITLFTALVGYMSFGEATMGVVLQNYQGTDQLINVGRFLYGFVVIFTYPLVFFACKKSLFTLCFPDLVEKPAGNLKANALSIGLLVVQVAIGIVVTSITAVLAYLGAVTGSCIVYVFPAVLSILLSPTTKQRRAISGRMQQELADPVGGASVGSVSGWRHVPSVLLLTFGIVMGGVGVTGEALINAKVLSTKCSSG